MLRRVNRPFLTALGYPGTVRWLLVFAAGCYSPTPPAGAPCGVGDTCPSDLVCTGGFCLAPGTATDGMPSDTPPDNPVTPDACTTFASQLDTCGVAAIGPLNINGNHTYNTDTHQLKNAGGTVIATTSQLIDGPAGRIDVIIATDFTLVSGVLQVTGSIPFGIVAFGTININGTLDASEGGSGAREKGVCGAAAGVAGITNALGSSGGGGGAFRGNGGNGGKGDANMTGTPVNGGIGGGSITLPTGPIGGCPGGIGGGGANVAGLPGAGGGAIYLVARSMINVNGDIDVGGSGGEHGHPNGGAGGGGGSGGMIVIEAPTVNVLGGLVANGGGGGGGADDIVDGNGQNGEAGRGDATRAKGGLGAGTAEGGDGGDGGAGTFLEGATSTEAADNGGGGGGGGVGFIAIGSPSKAVGQATISPALSAWPDPPQ